MEPRLAAVAGTSLILCALAGSSVAAPTNAPAKKLFDHALAAYAKADYPTAIDEFAKSFALQADPDTLFAWAQAERKVGDCVKAIELYDQLLVYKLPAENREAVTTARAECQKIVNDSPPEITMDSTTDAATTEPTTTEPAQATPAPGPVEPQANDHDTPIAAKAQAPEQPPAETNTGGGGHAWWRDPIGDSLVVVGLVGAGVGTALLVSGSSANHDKKTATSYGQFQSLQNRANTDGTGGVISCAAGAVFIAGGIVWYATHRDHSSSDHGSGPAVTGWLAPTSGGLAITGGF